MTMAFSFDEICIINLLVNSNNKVNILNSINDMIKYSDYKELKESLKTLYKKIESLSQENLNRLFNDKITNRVTVCPLYKMEL